MLAGTDDHLTWLSPVILNLGSTGLTHLESEMRLGGITYLINSFDYPNLLRFHSQPTQHQFL